MNRKQFISGVGLTSAGLIVAPHTILGDNSSGNVTGHFNFTDRDFDSLYYRYPSIDDDRVRETVSNAHSDLDKLKALVSARPELANACWDWGFGDFETAIGAASHMGRRDIAEFLISHGARPDIFTLAMMSAYESVKSIIETLPGIQRTLGPHGITLMQHAKHRLRHDTVPLDQQKSSQQLISYLESLGDADMAPKSMEIGEDEQTNYLGEYRFGDGADEIFEISLNMRKLLQIARKGTFGRVLNKVDNQLFFPGGAPSVRISFEFNNGKAMSLTIHEPLPFITANRI